MIKIDCFEQRKTVAIVTRYDNNYGACLQAAALQSFLSSVNVHGEIVRVTTVSEKRKSNIFNKGFAVIRDIGLIKTIKIALIKGFIKERNKSFDAFRNNEISITKESYVSADDMLSIGKRYDAFICGSDMIWCEEFLDLLDVYFLTFAPIGKRIAFSPSFGKAELNHDNKEKYKHFIDGMDYLSIRESSGVRLIKELTDRNSIHTVDPTFLLKKDDWLGIIPTNRALKGNKKYLLKYMFTELTSDGKALMRDICNAAGIVMRSVPFTRSEYIDEKANGMVGHGPYEFLSMYSGAHFVITNTFHGLLFALIFKKPFLVFKREDKGNWAKYDDRLLDILNKLNLSDRYISQNSVFKEELLYIDYSKIDPILDKWGEESKAYLIGALEEIFLNCLERENNHE